jgi:hypothetical protein
MYRMLSEIRIAENKDIIAYTAEAGVPVLFGRGEVGQKLVKLEGFWKDVISRHGVQELQYVDLRFADCIVVRWNHRPDDVQSSGI